MDGAEVDLVSHAGNFVARGLFNGQSKISVRLYSWEPERASTPISFALGSVRRFDCAARFLASQVPAAVRLVFSEGDGLSGLTVDQYDRWLAVQFTSLGLAQRRDMLAGILQESTGVDGIVLRTEARHWAIGRRRIEDGPLRGTMPEEPIVIQDGECASWSISPRGKRLGSSRPA